MRSLALLLALVVGSVSGQSFFNMGGLGEAVWASDAKSIGLGATAALSAANPGMLVDLQKTSIHVSGLGTAVLGRQSGVAGRAVGRMRPASLFAAAPLPLRVRLLVGVDSRFNQDFDVWSESLANSDYRRHVVGRGGIHDLRAGLALSILGRVGAGLVVNRLIGGSREHWQFVSGAGTYVATDTVEIDYSGTTMTLGASAQFPRFSLAAMYEPELKLDARRYLRVHGVVGDSVRKHRIELPNVVGLGLSAAVSRLDLSAGLELRPWGGATVDGRPALFRDVIRLSVGVEHEFVAGYPLRLGYSHQNWYFDRNRPEPELGTEPIGEHGIHFGTSVPVPKFGSVDLGGVVFFRRAVDLQELAGQFTLTLVYGEAWTKRTRRWGY
ncbi:MAG: hypothetical protein ABIK86_00815 [candidate division WOR-3 bacterium]